MSRMLGFAAALMTALLVAAPVGAADTSSSRKTPLTIYHIEGTRSERIVWLCEELGLPYQLEFKPGDRAASMQKIREVNPSMPMSPTVRYGDQILVESGAIIELLRAREGKGRLAPAVNSPDYPYYLQWMHFAEGSLAARIFGDYRVTMALGGKKPEGAPRMVGAEDVLRFADEFLGKHPYFGGQEFSAADIMMLFPIAYTSVLKVADVDQFKNVAAWRKRVEERPAYKRMVQKARPNG